MEARKYFCPAPQIAFYHIILTWTNIPLPLHGGVLRLESQAGQTSRNNIPNFLYKSYSEGYWHWAYSLEPLIYTNWWPGEPNDQNDQNCGVVTISDAYNLWWDDQGCEVAKGSICQIN